MDSFLRRDSVKQRGKDSHNSKPDLQSNLLFNPQRHRVPPPFQKVSESGLTSSSYWKARTAKLSSQAPTAASQIFAGLSFYFNGRSGEKQTMHLKGAVCKHGGKSTPFLSVKGVTHIIAENLSGVKTDKAMKSLKTKVVHPDWILNCIRQGRLLPDAPFRVVRSQELGIENFFTPSNAGKDKAKERPPRPTPSIAVGEQGDVYSREETTEVDISRVAGDVAIARNGPARGRQALSVEHNVDVRRDSNSVSYNGVKRRRNEQVHGARNEGDGYGLCCIDDKTVSGGVNRSSTSRWGNRPIQSSGAVSGVEAIRSTAGLPYRGVGKKRGREHNSIPLRTISIDRACPRPGCSVDVGIPCEQLFDQEVLITAESVVDQFAEPIVDASSVRV